jgi:hypothetical protein
MRARVLRGGALPLGVVACALPAERAAAQSDDVRALSPARVAAQVAAGAVATPVAFIGGGVLTKRLAARLGASDDRASQLAYVGAWTGAALATAAAPAAVGARGPGRGSFLAALGGALAGGVGSWALVRLNTRGEDDDAAPRPCRVLCRAAAIAVFTLPSVGATIAYDATRKPVR